MIDFNFDEWKELSETNPVEFERKRKALVEAMINKVPESHRDALLSLQMQCDAIRAAMHDDPLRATSVMLNMASTKLQTLKGPMTSLREIAEDFQELKDNE